MTGEPAPIYARDYQVSAVQARYGYYASVLRPGMSADQQRAAIKAIQTNPTFVADLSDIEIKQFIDNFEVVASSSQHPSAAATGLDAIVLRSRTTQNLLVSFGGVGPFQNVNTALGEGKNLLLDTSRYGFPVAELLAFKSFFDPLLIQYPNDVIDIVGHSKGGVLSSALYGDLLISGAASRVNLVFQLSPVGFNTAFYDNSLAANLNVAIGAADAQYLAYARSIISALRSDDNNNIVSFGAVDDPLAGTGSYPSISNNTSYFGFYRELLNDGARAVPHNANTAARLLGINLNNGDPLFVPSPALIAQLRDEGQPGDIIVTARKIKKVVNVRGYGDTLLNPLIVDPFLTLP